MSTAPARPFLLALLLGAAPWISAACEITLDSEGVTATETRRFDVDGRPEVVLDTFDGAIEIHTWNRDAVEVEVERRAVDQETLDAITITQEQDGNRVTLTVTGPSRSGAGISVSSGPSPTAILRVVVPRESNVQATSGDGSLAVEDVSGTIGLETGDGSVRAVNLSGDIRVSTNDGSIRLERMDGRLNLETNDGSVTLDGTPTALHARTGDGSMRVRVTSETTMDGDWDLTTGDGSVTLVLPPDFDANLDAESADGTVRASHGGIPESVRNAADTRDRDRRGTLRTTIGNGGMTLRIRTGDGSIRIED